MSMTLHTRTWVFWLLAAIGFFAFLYAVKAILLPFIVGILVAYFLDPPADRLEKWGFSRTMATTIITLCFFGLMILALGLLIPVILNQLEGLIQVMPDYVQQYQVLIQDRLAMFLSHVSEANLDSAKEAVSNSSGNVASAVGKLVKQVLSSGAALINLVSLIVITPVVSFYLLRDWDRMVAKIDSLLPQAYADTVREQVQLIDQTLSGYVRGVLNVMLTLGAFYAIALSLVGLNFPILIGLLGGVMVIIPYLGTIISGAAAVGMAYLQFDSWEPVAITLGIFTAGQMLEGYVLTPKLVGDKIGLHPLWLIFGMLCGAALFGFVGIFLAIPISAIIGVLVRFAITRYKNSEYYLSQRASDSNAS